MVEYMIDEEIFQFNWGGYDLFKFYVVYYVVVNYKGQLIVILVKIVKGYGIGFGEVVNKIYFMKIFNMESLKVFCDCFDMFFNDEELKKILFYCFSEDSNEMCYMWEWRNFLGGYLLVWRMECEILEVLELGVFGFLLEGIKDCEMLIIMVFV